MSLQLRWVGESEMDRVAEVRLRCYAHSARDIARFKDGIRADRRVEENGYLLAEQDGLAVGTTASLSLRMWVRGAPVRCQGVAYVGTIKTHRRGKSAAGGGVATQIMNESLRRARDQHYVLTALMPFRATFYEHFGYGLVETRHNWTLPISVLPTGPFDGFRFYEPRDRPAIEAARQRNVEAGQCDVERPSEYWDNILAKAEDGFVVVDRPDANGPVRGYLWFQHARENGCELLKITDAAFDDVDALRRQLHFLSSLRDQYEAVVWPLPPDLQLNWLLREPQLPHRPVTHATAKMCAMNRLQVRVLDHARFLEAMHLPVAAEGRAIVAVRETEGTVSRFALDVAGGRASAAPSDESVDFETTDRIWAAIACGELPATQAVQLGLAAANAPSAAELLNVFVVGPRPFSGEAF
jgi:predicted acetyltransferase